MLEHTLNHKEFAITLRNEECYSPSSADNVRAYDREYLLADGEFTSSHGVLCTQPNGDTRSCILLASGGATCVHPHSVAAVDDFLFVAVGDQLCSLVLPDLDLGWHRQVDEATCFGVYWSEQCGCLISHGELTISRLSLDGQLAWRASGRDIFSGGFSLSRDHVEVVDFGDARHRIDIETGRLEPA